MLDTYAHHLHASCCLEFKAFRAKPDGGTTKAFELFLLSCQALEGERRDLSLFLHIVTIVPAQGNRPMPGDDCLATAVHLPERSIIISSKGQASCTISTHTVHT